MKENMKLESDIRQHAKVDCKLINFETFGEMTRATSITAQSKIVRPSVSDTNKKL